LEDGDLIEPTSVVPNQFKHVPNQVFNFKAKPNKLSDAQQEVEELTDGQDDLSLLSMSEIQQLLSESDSPESLAFNLAQLIPKATKTEFTAKLDQALYAADMIGYVAASGSE
ncbi:hypothetical protein E0H79_03885, partial [Acinetobacter sp. ANC 5045]